MRTILAIMFVIIIGAPPLFADSWLRPVERDYHSDNGRFVAHVTPATSESKALLEVSEIIDQERVPHWDCELGNEGAPQRVLVSDDGLYVVTVNEWSARVHGGMGDYVLAFYTTTGLIKHYSLEALLGYPERITEREFRRLIMQSTSGRAWTVLTFLMESGQERMCCAWLTRGRRWLAWNVQTGEELIVDQRLQDAFDEKSRHWAIDKLTDPNRGYPSRTWAAETLSRLKRAEDRKYVEPLLKSEKFRTWYSLTGDSVKMGEGLASPVRTRSAFKQYHCYSQDRNTAEIALAMWDDRIIDSTSYSASSYHYLGVIEGVITLPRAPKPEDNCYLCIYLVPSTSDPNQWYLENPNQRLCVRFWTYHLRRDAWPSSTIPFAFYGVTPGHYHVKAVWDVAPPRSFHENRITGGPSRGDYENREAPLVCVEAGQTIGNVAIDCTSEVGDRSISSWASDCMPEPPPKICPCGKEHGPHRVCIVFDSPMPMRSFHYSPYHNFAPSAVTQDGNAKTYLHTFTKNSGGMSETDGRRFDISIQLLMVDDKLTRVTLEGPYFAVIPLHSLLTALSIDTTKLDGRKIESYVTIHGDPMPRIDLDASIDDVIRVLGAPTILEDDRLEYIYTRAGNYDGWIRFRKTKAGLLLRYETNLRGGTLWTGW